MEVEQAALFALLPDDAHPFIDRHVEALIRKRLLERTGPDRSRFSHALIRLAAYHSVPREDRARLHERFAGWLETGSTKHEPGLAQLLDYHLERAVTDRRAAGTRR